MNCCFAVYPDNDEPRSPQAVFETLEDALEWASVRVPGGACRIGHIALMLVQRDDQARAA
jgi:hypothetical protein